MTKLDPPFGPTEGGITCALGKYPSVTPNSRLKFFGFAPELVPAQRIFPDGAYVHFPPHPPQQVKILASLDDSQIPTPCKFTFRKFSDPGTP